MTEPIRCPWCGKNPLYIKYHDEEWGVPSHDDHHLFEMLCLEGAEAGLSWILILGKRENYRAAFDNFDAEKIALYDDAKIEELMQNPGIVRSRAKIQAFIANARAYLKVKDEFGTFDSYIWQFVNGKIIVNAFPTVAEVPNTTPESEAMSKALKKRGFKFVGPSVCYAYMQSCGLVNDHLTDCFRYNEVNR